MITKIRSLDRKKIAGWFPYLIVVLILIGVGGIVDDIITYIYVSKEFRYTIATKVEYHSTTRGSKRRYYYKVDGREYNDLTSIGLDYNGERYFIKYYPANPRRSVATSILADSNAIKNLPPDGYGKLPR